MNAETLRKNDDFLFLFQLNDQFLSLMADLRKMRFHSAGEYFAALPLESLIASLRKAGKLDLLLMFLWTVLNATQYDRLPESLK